MSQDMPLVSIICMCKNSRISIRRCVESVLSQDYPNFEFLIQDGVSTDGTIEIINEYRDDRIKLISEPDGGPSYAFLKLHQRVNGIFWGSCMSDEELMPNAVSWAVRHLKELPEAAVVYGDYFSTDIMGNMLSANRAAPWNFKRYLCCEIVPPFCSSFFRTEHYKSIGYDKYDECGEYDIWLRLGIRYPIYYREGYISKFSNHEDSITSKPEEYLKSLPGRIRAVETLVRQPSTPQEIVALKNEAIAGIHLWMAQTFLGLKDFEDFEKIIQESLSYSPNMDRFWSLILSYMEAIGSESDISTRIHFIEEIKRKLVLPKIIFIHLFCLFIKKGMLHEAYRYAMEALTVMPEDPDIKGIISKFNAAGCSNLNDPLTPYGLNRAGELLFLKGRHNEALARFRKALALDPDNWLTHNNLGVFYWQTGDSPKAAEHLTEAFRLNPEDAMIAQNYHKVIRALRS